MPMTIQQFIEKATRGGWKPSTNIVVDAHEPQNWGQVLLDPSAWKAVGKAEGWHEHATVQCKDHWLKQMHRMIDALAGGETIEEYLATL